MEITCSKLILICTTANPDIRISAMQDVLYLNLGAGGRRGDKIKAPILNICTICDPDKVCRLTGNIFSGTYSVCLRVANKSCTSI